MASIESLLEAALEDSDLEEDDEFCDEADSTQADFERMASVYSQCVGSATRGGHVADALKIAQMLMDSQGEARSPERPSTLTARAASSQASFLNNDAGPLLTGRRTRLVPKKFVAGGTKVRGSILAHRSGILDPTWVRPNPRATNQNNDPHRNAARRVRRREARQAHVQGLAVLADKTFLDLSWQQRRNFAVCTYSQAMNEGCGKMQAATIASFAARVDERTVREYVKSWMANEGFFSPCNWGKNQKVPCYLDDEHVKSQARRWLQLNTGFKKGSLTLVS